jgi:hypothetical protein
MSDSKSLRAVIAIGLVCSLITATSINLYARDARIDARSGGGAVSEHKTHDIVVTSELAETATGFDDTPGISTPAGEQPSLSPNGSDQAQGTTRLQGRTIIVNDRTLTGPASTAQQRGGRIFLPVTSIARALGDTIKVDAATRMVEAHRQTGVRADFNAELGQVRENGSVILAVSNAADIIFPPNADELALPVEIVSALLDVSIRMDEAAQAIKITRGHAQAETV